MVIGILGAMLLLSGSVVIGSVQSALGFFLGFAALSFVYTTACMGPGYVKARTACSTVRIASRARQSTSPVGAGVGR
jgi:hypothetical protein